MEHTGLNLTLKVWKQKNAATKGAFESYDVKNISTDMSFLEMFDVLNEQLISTGKEPIAFAHMGHGMAPLLVNCTCGLSKMAIQLLLNLGELAHFL